MTEREIITRLRDLVIEEKEAMRVVRRYFRPFHLDDSDRYMIEKIRRERLRPVRSEIKRLTKLLGDREPVKRIRNNTPAILRLHRSMRREVDCWMKKSRS